MADRYWVGGKGNWDETTTTHWSASSGGAGGSSVPTSSDDVFIDANSGTGTVTIKSNYACKSLDFNGYTGTLAGTVGLYCYGSLRLSSSMTNNYYGGIIFKSTSTGNTITSNGISLQSITFSGIGGEWTLQDEYSGLGVSLLAGSFITNNNNLSCSTFYLSPYTYKTRSLSLGSSIITVAQWDCSYPSDLTFDSGTSTIKITGSYLIGGDQTYNNVWFSKSSGTLTVEGSNTFNDFKADGTAAYTIAFTGGTTQTVSTFTGNGSSGKLITLTSTNTTRVTLTKTGGGIITGSDYLSVDYINGSPVSTWALGTHSTIGANTTYLYTAILAPTVTTQAVSSIKTLLSTGNGTVTSDNNSEITERGICWKTSTGPTTSDSKKITTGTTGAYTGEISPTVRNTLYYVRAYAINGIGTSYGSEVTFTSAQFTNPANIYSSNNVYTTVAAISGVLTVEVSKNAGVTSQTAKTVTFTSTEAVKTCGTGSTELWGTTFTRADVVDAKLRIRLSHNGISQVYKTFGFSTGADILTGIEVAIEGKYASSTISLDHLKVKIYYGTSVLPVQAGSQAFASNGRKAGEGAGAGSGVLVFYDGSSWIAVDSGGIVSA